MSPTLGLIARTRVIPGGIDLVSLCDDDDALFVTNGVGVIGIGCAARISVPRRDSTSASSAATSAFADIEVFDELERPGTGPLALGAFPFDPTAEGQLILPRIILGCAADGS